MPIQLQSTPSRLIVGGHSFIAELGNDPVIDFDRQLEIVNTCIDAGITGFDTTYEPERIAVGRVLKELKRRDQAQIMAWNFFNDPGTGQHIVAPRPFMPHDLDTLLEQFNTTYIDLLVVHPVHNDADHARQTEVAQSWLAAGHVRALGTWVPGTWVPGTDLQSRFGARTPYTFMVAPRNVAQPGTAVFQAGKALGWRTLATSPFGRGWLLDKLFAVAAVAHPGASDALRLRLADAMLRFSLHGPAVDHVIVGIRKREWIFKNLESIQRGPLSDKEVQWLLELLAQVPSAA